MSATMTGLVTGRGGERALGGSGIVLTCNCGGQVTRCAACAALCLQYLRGGWKVGVLRAGKNGASPARLQPRRQWCERARNCGEGDHDECARYDGHSDRSRGEGEDARMHRCVPASVEPAGREGC